MGRLKRVTGWIWVGQIRSIASGLKTGRFKYGPSHTQTRPDLLPHFSPLRAKYGSNNSLPNIRVTEQYYNTWHIGQLNRKKPHTLTLSKFKTKTKVWEYSLLKILKIFKLTVNSTCHQSTKPLELKQKLGKSRALNSTIKFRKQNWKSLQAAAPFPFFFWIFFM